MSHYVLIVIGSAYVLKTNVPQKLTIHNYKVLNNSCDSNISLTDRGNMEIPDYEIHIL